MRKSIVIVFIIKNTRPFANILQNRYNRKTFFRQTVFYMRRNFVKRFSFYDFVAY